MLLYALIPAYNCASTVAAVVQGVQRQGIEALVVDDGSSDATAEAARAAGACAVVRHPENRGKGHALVTGFRWALDHGADGVITLDADGQHSPEDLPVFLERAADAELLIGRRRRHISTMPVSSFIGNTVSTFWISLFCGEHFPDPQCGFRLYSRTLLERVPLLGGRFEAETDLLIRASRLGLRIGWVPIQTIYARLRGPRPTHYRNFSDTLRVIATVLGSTRFPRAGR